LLVFNTRGDSGGLRRKKAETISVDVNLRRRFRTRLADVGTTRWLLWRLDLEKERNMRSVLRRSTLLLAIAAAAPLIAGCATRASVEMAQATANQALATAQSATSAAAAAQDRADQAQQTAQTAQASAQAATVSAAAAQTSAAAATTVAAAAQTSASQALADARAADQRAATFAQARGPRG
jgi:hypothetical protein